MFKKEQGKQIVEEYIESQKTIKRYIKGNLLGVGGFAKCYEFLSEQTNRKYAAKIIQKASLNKPKAKQKLQSEIKIHKSLSHHNIVQFQHFFEDEDYVYILLEVCRPETLNNLLKRRKRITQFQVKYYIFQIVEALKYVHSKKVIHRDLKLGNLFLTDDLHIKLGDFGLAAKLTHDSERKKTTCGTPNYLAPQILLNKNGHSYQVDIWSLGVLTYALLFGRPPFETNELKLTYSKIKTLNYSFPETAKASQSAKKFITKILQLEPHKRPTLEQILQDDFMQSIQIPKFLPLATLSIPPSANFIKKYQKVQQKNSQFSETAYGSAHRTDDSGNNLSSFRTLERNRIMMSTQKLQICEKDNNLLKRSVSKENLHLQRASSAVGLIQRKKSISKPLITKAVTIQKAVIPVRVIHHEDNPKFGASYMLSTNAIGMRYNDSTCLISNSLLSKIKYVVLESGLKQVASSVMNYEDVPSNLAKKMKIINHYTKELKKRKEEVEAKMSNEMRIQLERLRTKESQQNIMSVYVIRSLKTSKACFFQFNTGYTQVIFEDSSELIFKQKQVITYINKFSDLKQFKWDTIQEQNQDFKKRINYALSVTQRVKKSINVEIKQNKTQPQKAMGRSVSTAKLSFQPSLLSKQSHKNYSSTAKLRTTSASSNIHPTSSVALREISNRPY